MTLHAARQVADAVLYEGYLLYPYRASSAKNQVRWQFGILGPAGAAAAGAGEETSMSAELVLEAGDGRIDVQLRFLQVQSRVVQRRTEAGWQTVDELLVAGARWVAYHEAVAREVDLPGLTLVDQQHLVELPGGEDIEELHEDGVLVGRLVRTRWPLTGTLELTAVPAEDPRLQVLRVEVVNTGSWEPAEGCADRDAAARTSFVGTHLLVSASGTRFVSLLEGPDWADADTQSRTQHRCWPVLISADDGTDAVLVAPIILGDHPAIAPESAGDLFDATEIDEILTLRVMTLTEEEKEQARGTDPRAAAILERCDGMSDEAMDRLHGARRDFWGEQDEPEREAVVVAGVPVSKGTRVLLRPSRNADAQDMFLAGLTAVVQRVYSDVDGGTHVAVTLEDDPAAELYGATGRFYYFGPEELEPLPARAEQR